MPPNDEADSKINRTSLETVLDTSPEVESSRVKRKEPLPPIELIAPEQFEDYHASVLTDDFVFLEQAYIRKTKYIISELVSELGFQSYRHLTMWITLLILLLMIWASRFSHYMGQWIYLKAEGVPVTTFDFLWLTVDLDYPNEVDM
jgi:hypothetical protein